MSLELSWSCSGSVSGQTVNVINPYTDVVNGPAWELWWFKERLKEFGWTVVSSSNSSTASAGDLWGSTFDSTTSDGATKNAKIKFGSNSAARSWIALAAPTGSNAAGHHLIIDYGNESNVAYRAQFIFNKGAISGGATNSRPTGSYEMGLSVAGGLASKDIAFHDSTTNSSAQHRVNFHAATNGAFYISEVQVGKGRFTFFLSFLPLQNTHAVDNYTWVVAGVDVHTATTFTPADGRALYYESSAAITGRSHDGSNFTSLAGVIPAVSTESSAGALSALFHTNILSSPNSSDATYTDFPIFVVNTSTGPIEFKGRLPDISWTSVSIPNGAVTPPKSIASDKYERTKYLYTWLPWVSSNAPVL